MESPSACHTNELQFFVLICTTLASATGIANNVFAFMTAAISSVLTMIPMATDLASVIVGSSTISDLSQWLNRQDTDPILHEIIIDSLTARDLHTTELLTTIPHSRSHAIALATQTMIGWENMLLGFIAKEFTTTQQTYYEYIGSKRTGSRWTTNLVKQLWRILQAMWLSRNRIKYDTEIEGTTANTILLRGAITRVVHSRVKNHIAVESSFKVGLPRFQCNFRNKLH